MPDAARYTPPELARSGWEALKRSPHSAVDSYNFGTLIFEVFNGTFTGPEQAGQTKNIPPGVQASYKRLVNANPKARLSVAHFLEQGLRRGSFFDSPLIKLTEGVDNLGVKSEEEREAFLEYVFDFCLSIRTRADEPRDLDQLTDDFPEDFFKMKVLPELLKSVEFGGGGPKAFGVVMKIATALSNDDFDSKVTPVVIRLFGNPDRALRVCLLDNLPLMIDRLSQKVVTDKIFPQIVSIYTSLETQWYNLHEIKVYEQDWFTDIHKQVTGFTDVAPVVREQTLKSVLTLVSKLSERIINGELLRYLAKTANDEQPGIRTNTTICLGKIAKHLSGSSRPKVLIAAFSRSLRDPFVHARNAALLALAVTGDYFSDEDCALRILPAISPLLIDKEKLIRDQANKTIDVYLARIRKAQSGMPETVLPPESAATGAGGAGGMPRMSTPQPAETSSGMAAAWAGWAISSFTNKLSAAAGEIQSNGATAAAASSSAAASRRPAPTTSSSASVLHRQALKSPPPTSSTGPSSAPLSRNSSSGNLGGDFFPDADEDAAADNFGDAWGDMGDMDEGDNDNDGGFFEAGGFDGGESVSSSTTLPKKKTTTTTSTPAASAGLDDGSEPDFAGWLAAQAAARKDGAGVGGLGGSRSKALPKGLAKPSTATAATTNTTSKPVVKKTTPVAKAPVKKIDLKPKPKAAAADDDDDGWGGW